MKLNKYLCGLFVAAIAGLTSCNTDVEGEYYPFGNVDGKYVSFDAPGMTVQVPNTESSVTIPVTLVRSNTAEALTLNLTTTSTHQGIFSIADGASSVTFNPGEGQKTINVLANNLEKEVTYGYAISLDGKATIDTLRLQTSHFEKFVKFFPADPEDEESKDSIAIDSVATDYYKSNPTTQMQIVVTREGDWTPWQAWNSAGTATFLYVNFWEGEDPELPFVYRRNEILTNRYQFKISNWGYGVDLVLDYDSETGIVSCPPQFTGYTHPSYGDVYVTDLANYDAMMGWAVEDGDYGTFDAEQGIFTLPLAYYVSAGTFGYDPEYLYIDGIVRGDYSSSLSYIGVLTDINNEVFALGNLELGPDATNVKAIVMPQDADVDAVADALASGDLEGYDVEAGQIQVPITEDLSGKLQIIVAVIADGVVKSVSSAKFEYYGGNNPWTSLGKGVLTDNFLAGLIGSDPVSFEVEVMENKDNPGLYKLIYPYGENYPLNDPGDWDTSLSYDIEIDATDPDGVVIYNQPTGVDWGRGLISIQSIGARYNVDGGYDLATLKEDGYLGTLENGVITLPIFEREGSDGSKSQYQGFITMGSTLYYGGVVGEFKLVLPGSPALSAAKKVASRDRHFRNTKMFRAVQAQKFVKNVSLSKTKIAK